MKLRSEINNDFKWDITKFCKNYDDYYNRFKKLKPLIAKTAFYKGKLNKPENVIKYFKLAEEFDILFDELFLYVALQRDVNFEDSKADQEKGILESVFAEYSNKNSFVSSELLSYGDNYLKELLNNKDLKNYKIMFKDLMRLRKHVLSDEIESVLANITFDDGFSEIFHAFDDADVKFEDVVTKNGTKLVLDESTIYIYLQDKDRVLRKSTFENLHKGYKNFSNTLAKNYIANVKKNLFFSKTRRYGGVLSGKLKSDNIKPVVYNKLIENINNNLKLLYKYFSLRANILGLKNYTYYDNGVSLIDYEKDISFNEAMETMYSALSVMGQDYVALLKRSLTEKWVDIYPNKNKRSGAYSWGTTTQTPVILLNHLNKLDDLFTIVHEYGHALHSYYSNLAQPYNLRSYTIFNAEVASTVNEILLIKYLYANAKTKAEKINYLDKYLKMFRTTIFRQTMFSQFEEYAHNLVQENLPISKDILLKYYGELNKKYCGKDVKYNNLIEYECLRIPHFYKSFYVYKYATGMVSAISIARDILNKKDFVKKYIKYLSSGSSDYSVNLLKLADVNLETNEPYDKAFSEMKWALSELEKLTKKQAKK